jgi:hypothetical protein
MNPLKGRLATFRRRLRWSLTARGVSVTAASLLAGLLACALLDSFLFRLFAVETWSLVRAAFLTVTVAITGLAAHRFLLRPLGARTDDLSLALRVEDEYPVLNDALASTVQFLETSGSHDRGVSASLQQEAIARALRLAEGCDFNKAIKSKGLRQSAICLAVLLAIGLPLVFLQPASAWVALTRFADPFGEHPWVQLGEQTRLKLQFPHHLAIGQPLSIIGEVRGAIPPKATIEFDEISMPVRQVDVKVLGEGSGQFVASGIRLPSHRREIRFRAKAGDAVDPPRSGDWHTVVLRQPPQLAALGGKPSPQIVVRQPLYTGLPEYVTLPDGTGNLDVPEGSIVTLRGAASERIARAWVEFKPLLPGAREALSLSGVGYRSAIDHLVTTAVASAAWDQVPAQLDADGRVFAIQFRPAVTGAYLLVLEDQDGLTKAELFDLTVRPDPAPTVNLLRPSTSQSVLANADVSLQIQAEDDVYALRTIYLEYRRKDKHGQWIDPAPKQLLFYDSALAEPGLPVFLNAMSASPVPLPSVRLHLRPKRMTFSYRWSLRGLAIEGETVVIQACARDFNDVVAFPQVGRSHEIELKVVGKTALDAVLDEHESSFQQQIARLREMQETATKKVIGAEQQWRATGQLRPEDLVDVLEAEQLQKEIQARIGSTKEEGLRAELGQFEEMLKDNKLSNKEIADRARAIREELERINRENLPRIEPALTKARRELDGPAQPMPPLPKDDGDLGEARKEQEKIEKALSELLKNMEDQASMQQLKGEMRSVLQEQQELQKDVEKLKDQADKDPTSLSKDAKLKAALRRAAELQRRLAGRAERMIDQLEKQAQNMTDKGDVGSAEMLEKAADIGKKAMVPPSMRAAAESLQDNFDRPQDKKKTQPDLNIAQKTQADVAKSLESMLDALDQTNVDEVKRLIVRQKQEQQHLEDLNAKMSALKDKIDAARKIADPKERQETLKKLADEQRELQKLAEQRSREMAKAHADAAAEDLRDAAKNMERLARILERDDDPLDAMKEIDEQLQNAKNDLKDAQAESEQALSREQMAKMVDRLKGLRERQAAALTETQRLRQDFLNNRIWRAERLTSIGDLRTAQGGVRGETESMRDTLKGAKVFYSMLDRTGADMKNAIQKLEDWSKLALTHSVPYEKNKVRPTLQDKDFQDEKAVFEAVSSAQLAAGERLQRLIDALLPELEPQDGQKGDGQGGGGNPGGGGGKQEKKGGIAAQDGIPPVAQLKALRAEQTDVNARTKEFAEQHPDLNNLTPMERSQLDAIRAEQDRLLQLFRDLVTSGKGGEDNR